jgi:hypothetical protein
MIRPVEKTGMHGGISAGMGVFLFPAETDGERDTGREQERRSPGSPDNNRHGFRSPGTGQLPVPPMIYRFQKQLVEDSSEDFPLFEGWGVLGIIESGFDLVYDIACIGHG